jgi:hypothetical protein
MAVIVTSPPWRWKSVVVRVVQSLFDSYLILKFHSRILLLPKQLMIISESHNLYLTW